MFKIKATFPTYGSRDEVTGTKSHFSDNTYETAALAGYVAGRETEECCGEIGFEVVDAVTLERAFAKPVQVSDAFDDLPF